MIHESNYLSESDPVVTFNKEQHDSRQIRPKKLSSFEPKFTIEEEKGEASDEEDRDDHLILRIKEETEVKLNPL